MQSALDILEDDILASHERSEIEVPLFQEARPHFCTEEFEEPEEGFNGYAFRRYVLHLRVDAVLGEADWPNLSQASSMHRQYLSARR